MPETSVPPYIVLKQRFLKESYHACLIFWKSSFLQIIGIICLFVLSHSRPWTSRGQKYCLPSLHFAVLSKVLNIRQVFNKYWMTEWKLSKCCAVCRIFSSLTFDFTGPLAVIIKLLTQLNRSSLGASGRSCTLQLQGQQEQSPVK